MKMTKRAIFIFMAPAVILLLVVFLYPTVRTSLMSLFNVKNVTSPVATWEFSGLQNFQHLFGSRLFIISLQNIAKLWLFCGIATIFLALLFAVMLTSGMRGKTFFRTIIYMPNVIAAVAIGYMWLLYVFNTKFGLLTSLFSALGLKSLAEIPWTSPQYLFLAMSIAYVFSNMGYYMLMYMAAIEKISPDYYEAATIEGASVVRKFFHITLPLIKGVLGTSVVLWTTKTMAFFALSEVFKDVSTQTPMQYTYNALFGTELSAENMNVGVAAAAAVVMTVIVLTVFVISNKLIKDEGHEL